MLGDLPGGDYPHAWATGVSADGSVVVGTGSRGDAYTGREAFRWTEETGMQGLGTGGLSESFATGVSGDGSTVVGYTFRQYAGIVACLWDASGRLRFVDDVLRDDYGLDLGGWELRAATAISPDGRAIVGYGKNPLGQEEAWIAVIPEPTTLSLLVLGGLAMLRRRGRK
jgi:probable HAF family extracellular repeat protein